MSLISKVRRGASWSISVRFATQVINLIKIPILARLLSPEDFGLMGIVSLVLMYLEVLSRTGFENALIQKAKPLKIEFESAWSLNALRGFGQALMILILARPIAAFYDESQLLWLLVAISIKPILIGLKSIGLVDLRRSLKFKELSIYEFGGSIVSVLITLLIAMNVKNVWALIIGDISSAFYALVVSYVITRRRKLFGFSWIHVRGLWQFGKWELVGAIAVVLFNTGDDIFVGKFLGIALLGYYTIAYRVGNLVTTEVINSVRRVFFPAYSILQNDLARLRRGFFTLYTLGIATGGLVTVGLIILSPQITRVLLGPKWTPVIPVIRILAIWGFIDIILMTSPDLFRAVGRPDWFAKLTVLKVIILALSIVPLSRWWGIEGAAMAVVLGALSAVPLTFYWVKKTLEINISQLIKPLIGPMIGALASILIIYSTNWIWMTFNEIAQLVGMGLTITCTYILVQFLFDKLFNFGLLEFVHLAVKD